MKSNCRHLYDRVILVGSGFFNFLIFIACTVFYRRKYESGLRIAGSGFVLLLIRGFRFVDRFSVVRCMASLSLIMVFFLGPAPVLMHLPIRGMAGLLRRASWTVPGWRGGLGWFSCSSLLFSTATATKTFSRTLRW